MKLSTLVLFFFIDQILHNYTPSFCFCKKLEKSPKEQWVAKKSFFSKLFVFVVALLPLFFSSLVSAASEADFTGGTVPTSSVTPDGWSVDRKSVV